MRRRSTSMLALLAVVAALAVIRAMHGGAAPKPAMFSDSATLADALGSDDGRLVMVLATADWCGPCQSLKRSALSDPAVEAWVRANATPVYLDLTAPGEDERQAAERLAIGPIPTIVLLRDGQELGRHVGAAGGERLLRWLEGAGGP